jgi:dihydropteroate synthase
MKMLSKICILSTVHQALDDRIFHKEAKTLARAGYEVVLIAQHDGDEMVDGVKIVGFA